MSKLAAQSKRNLFKKLTPDSLIDLDNRLKVEKELEAQRILDESEDHQHVAEKKCGQKILDLVVKKKKPRTLNDKRANKEYLTGNSLPERLTNHFPPELAGVPIEDLDDFYKMEHVYFVSYYYYFNKIFFIFQVCVVVNKGGSIFRFNTKKALFVLSPLNPIRRLAIYVLTHSYPFIFLVEI
jgi:hypothetical protein